MNVKTSSVAGLAMIACVGSGAGLVAANPCFVSEQVNTCTQLPELPFNECYNFLSKNLCAVGVSAEEGLSSIGSSQNRECTYETGVRRDGKCRSDGEPPVEMTLDCQPAVGTACVPEEAGPPPLVY